jgi:hypothetical protein
MSPWLESWCRHETGDRIIPTWGADSCRDAYGFDDFANREAQPSTHEDSTGAGERLSVNFVLRGRHIDEVDIVNGHREREFQLIAGL